MSKAWARCLAPDRNVIYVTFPRCWRSLPDSPGLLWTLTDNHQSRHAQVRGLRLGARGYTVEATRGRTLPTVAGQRPRVTGSIDGAIGRDYNEPGIAGGAMGPWVTRPAD
jgi:hypothetical protein